MDLNLHPISFPFPSIYKTTLHYIRDWYDNNHLPCQSRQSPGLEPSSTQELFNWSVKKINRWLSTRIHVNYAIPASKSKITLVACMECKTDAWYLLGIDLGVLHLLGKYNYLFLFRQRGSCSRNRRCRNDY